MKSLKFVITACLMAFATSVFAANGSFVNNQIPDNATTLNGAKSINPKAVLYFDVDATAKTIVFKRTNGTLITWNFATVADLYTVVDKFTTCRRALGCDFYYTSTYGTNIHRWVSYANVTDVVCTVTTPVGGTFYTVSIRLINDEIIPSDGYSVYVCQNFD